MRPVGVLFCVGCLVVLAVMVARKKGRALWALSMAVSLLGMLLILLDRADASAWYLGLALILGGQVSAVTLPLRKS